ncbi:MAG: 50S ribosomal protein L31e [archaeon]|nr:50S ribosomal protein L31e [archaeon]
MSDSKIELERMYTVPLSRAWIAPRYRRTSRAVNVLKEFAERHMKSSEIKIDSELNETLWKRGITKPPRRITVKMTKDEDGLVTISLPELEEDETEAKSVEPEKEEDKISTGSDSSKQEEVENSAVSQQTETVNVPDKKTKQPSMKSTKKIKPQKKSE